VGPPYRDNGHCNAHGLNLTQTEKKSYHTNKCDKNLVNNEELTKSSLSSQSVRLGLELGGYIGNDIATVYA